MLSIDNRQSHIQHTADPQHLEQQQQQQQIIVATQRSNMYEETPEQQQQQQQQEEEEQLGDNEVNLNFSTFEELCRLCAIHHGPPKMHIFEPEAEQRQLLYKLRTLLQANVSRKLLTSSVYWRV